MNTELTRPAACQSKRRDIADYDGGVRIRIPSSGGVALIVLTVLGGSPAAATPGTKHLARFQIPSHNIGCILAGGTARCDLKHRTYKLPTRPKSCTHIVDFGRGVEVDKTGAAHIVCAGDTALNPRDTVLPYSSSDRYGIFICQSQTAGVTCTNTTNGHGFFVSTRSYRLF